MIHVANRSCTETVQRPSRSIRATEEAPEDEPYVCSLLFDRRDVTIMSQSNKTGHMQWWMWKRCQTCGKQRLLTYFSITGISCKSCLCMRQKEGCQNYVGGERHCSECVEIKRTKKKESRRAWDAACRSDTSSYCPDMASFGVRLLTKVSKGKGMIVSETPIFSGSECDTINQWMKRSSFSIQPINWDDHNDTFR